MSRENSALTSIHYLAVTGQPLARSEDWDCVKHSMLEMTVQERTNQLSAKMAAALLASLQLSGAPAPSATLDPDGDVVLTWHRGAIKGSAVVAEDRLSGVVTNGAHIEHVSPEINAVEGGHDQLELFSQGVVKWMKHSKGLGLAQMTARSSTFPMSTVFADKSLLHTWRQSVPVSKAFTTFQVFSNFNQSTEELSLFTGKSTLPPLKL